MLFASVSCVIAGLGLFIVGLGSILSRNNGDILDKTDEKRPSLRLDLPVSPKHCQKAKNRTESQETSGMSRMCRTLLVYRHILHIPERELTVISLKTDGNDGNNGAQPKVNQA